MRIGISRIPKKRTKFIYKVSVFNEHNRIRSFTKFLSYVIYTGNFKYIYLKYISFRNYSCRIILNPRRIILERNVSGFLTANKKSSSEFHGKATTYTTKINNEESLLLV